MFKIKTAFSFPGWLFGLFMVWLCLSGHYTVLLISLGIASTFFVVLMAARMNSLDPEGELSCINPLRLMVYWAWLVIQIIKANIEVCIKIMHPRMPIHPLWVVTKPLQSTHLGRVIYANSITLTPGTVAVNMNAHEITVHALDKGTAESLQKGILNRHAAAIEREKPCLSSP